MYVNREDKYITNTPQYNAIPPLTMTSIYKYIIEYTHFQQCQQKHYKLCKVRCNGRAVVLNCNTCVPNKVASDIIIL